MLRCSALERYLPFVTELFCRFDPFLLPRYFRTLAFMPVRFHLPCRLPATNTLPPLPANACRFLFPACSLFTSRAPAVRSFGAILVFSAVPGTLLPFAVSFFLLENSSWVPAFTCVLPRGSGCRCRWVFARALPAPDRAVAFAFPVLPRAAPLLNTAERSVAPRCRVALPPAFRFLACRCAFSAPLRLRSGERRLRSACRSCLQHMPLPAGGLEH